MIDEHWMDVGRGLWFSRSTWFVWNEADFFIPETTIMSIFVQFLSDWILKSYLVRAASSHFLGEHTPWQNDKKILVCDIGYYSTWGFIPSLTFGAFTGIFVSILTR